jgi:hypothetical protein
VDGWMGGWMQMAFILYRLSRARGTLLLCCVTYPPCAFTNSGGALSVVHL